MDIKKAIIEVMTSNFKYEQMPKKDLLEWVSVKCDCAQKEVSSAYSELKKEGITYSVTGLQGWVGINKEKCV